jgi:NADPH2:quinone reductase
MAKAIVLHQTGGPEQLRYEDVEVPPPGDSEVQVRHTAIGLNFIDVYDRTGLYPIKLPAILGHEAAGVVASAGGRVKGFAPGERVVYTRDQPGSYCELRNVPADRLLHLPDEVSDEDAAASLLKGLTAQYLLRQTFRVKKSQTIVIHAAAGGVGSIAVQWAKHLGATVIGTVGSETKAQFARELGCDHLVLPPQSLSARVKEITAGQGVPVVYDSAGKDTFFESLDSLARLGLMVSYGNSTGPVPPIAPLELAKRGSLFLTRPTLFHYIDTRAKLEKAAKDLFQVIGSGAVKIRIGQRYALRDAAAAHADLEARRTTGCTVLIP